jgi:hypothetical protein
MEEGRGRMDEKKTSNIERPTSNLEQNRKDGQVGETGIFKNGQKMYRNIQKHHKNGQKLYGNIQ